MLLWMGEAYPWLWVVGERQSQTLVVGGERWGFSWQSQTLLVAGEEGVLKAVSDAGWEGGRRGGGFHGSPNCFLWGGYEALVLMQSQPLVVGGEVVVLMAVSHAGCGGQRLGPHGSLRCWLCWGEWGFPGRHIVTLV